MHRSDSCFQVIIDQAQLDAGAWGAQALKDSLRGDWMAAGHSEQWSGIASGNLAHNLYQRGDYANAIRLYEYDIEVAEKYGIKGLIIGAATSLADMYISMGRLPLAKAYLDRAYGYARELV